MKKLISLLLALVMVLSLSTVAFAAETTYEDMSTVTLTKEYKLANTGTTSPAETFTFSDLTCTGVSDAGVGVTKDNAPVPTIDSATFEKGAAGDKTKGKQTITITMPEYNAVGIYTYTFTENDGNTAGVSYRSEAITLVVTVIEQNGKVRVAAVHAGEKGAKSGNFDNTYSAGSLAVKKNVTGNLGDKTKEFNVTVTFSAPEGDTVREAITYVDGTETKTIPANWNTSASANITLKNGETVTFTNIPYGVTYTVEEDDYTSEAAGKYDPAVYGFSDDTNKKIDSDMDTVTITNNKNGTVDTGVMLDSLPYILVLAFVAVAGTALILKKRANV